MFDDGSGLFEGQVCRLCPDRRLGQHDPLGVGAVLRDAELAAAAPDFGPDQVFRPFAHDAGKVAAWHAGPDRVRHEAQRRLDVRRVDSGSHDFDDHLAGAGRRGVSSRYVKLEVVDVGGLFGNPQPLAGM
jgi:hypothetical protein